MDNSSMEQKRLVQKIHLLRTMEIFRPLPNENWYNFQQMFCT